MAKFEICLTCKKLFRIKRNGQNYCSRNCARKNNSGWTKEQKKQKEEQFTEIVESYVYGPERDNQIIVDRIVPSVRNDPKLREQLVMFVSILRSKGFEIVDVKSKNLTELVKLSQFETDMILKPG